MVVSKHQTRQEDCSGGRQHWIHGPDGNRLHAVSQRGKAPAQTGARHQRTPHNGASCTQPSTARAARAMGLLVLWILKIRTIDIRSNSRILSHERTGYTDQSIGAQRAGNNLADLSADFCRLGTAKSGRTKDPEPGYPTTIQLGFFDVMPHESAEAGSLQISPKVILRVN